jgi:hypothetical protein
MSVKATYAGEIERNNTKGLLFKLKFTGNYGANGVGDLLDLTPGNILDPTLSYNTILVEPPTNLGVLNEPLGGSYIALLPNANPTLQNLGVQMWEPAGAEKATNAAYTAAELAGFAEIVVFVPLQ